MSRSHSGTLRDRVDLGCHAPAVGMWGVGVRQMCKMTHFLRSKNVSFYTFASFRGDGKCNETLLYSLQIAFLQFLENRNLTLACANFAKCRFTCFVWNSENARIVIYIYAKWCFFTVHDRIAPKSVKRHILGGKKVLLFTLLRVPRGEENATKRYYIQSKLIFCNSWKTEIARSRMWTLQNQDFQEISKSTKRYIYTHIIDLGATCR